MLLGASSPCTLDEELLESFGASHGSELRAMSSAASSVAIGKTIERRRGRSGAKSGTLNTKEPHHMEAGEQPLGSKRYLDVDLHKQRS